MAPDSNVCQAARVVVADGQVVLTLEAQTQVHRQAMLEQCQIGDLLPGLAVELQFSDGARFTPDDVDFRWPGMATSQRLIHWLEGHWSAVLVAVVLVPLFLWLMLTRAVPAAADASVSLLPEVVADTVSEHTLYLMDTTMLKPSALSLQQRHAVIQNWHSTLSTLAMTDNGYRLQFRSGPIGANAFALPDGTVVVLDDIVTLMEDHPKALTAVLLHEMGHVQHQHGLKLLARASANSLLFAVLLGDIEGAGEMIIGAGASLVENAFSREMETEADQYAYDKLVQLGLSPRHFADAMRLLSSGSTKAPAQAGPEVHWDDYFSTHPDTLDRIRAAEQASAESTQD
ncbi:M48 family metallopeptidase [Ferrimonas sp. SCSIO 43195]|uniref:M48 family metallopeptidase n=1 Tax=Ferrimonas sp. SCSIO 43195 TaxID=2822844 RepID=UPI0020756576|nr:M48 family metallopeptidase [Ferrimonas sp. SCSIO 43195]USD35764.1 M48 family metallopeptidase [Ferrimonas sp. SCSIO 43195]